jgi:hypothetical protein
LARGTDVINRNLAADQGVDVRDYELDHRSPSWPRRRV